MYMYMYTYTLFQSGVSCQCSSESDEEPVTKQPRLSCSRQSCGSGRESPASAGTTPTTTITNSTTTTTTTITTTSTTAKYVRTKQTKRFRSRIRRDSERTNSSRNEFSDSDASSEIRSVDEGSYFEVRIIDFIDPFLFFLLSFSFILFFFCFHQYFPRS